MVADVDWEQIKAEYLSGNVSCRQLAEKYHLSPNVVSKKATKDGWKNERRKTGELVAKKTVSRVARARADAAMKGLDLTKYTMEIWSDNLKTLNETIKNTPNYMLENPSFASGIAKGLQTTYELLLKASGQADSDRKLELERQKLELERQKFELEKQKWAMEQERLKVAGGTEYVWEIVEEGDENE